MTISIPVMHSFNDNYAIPAGVAFHSMLENSSNDYQYQLYVLHSDISPENQKKLEGTVQPFRNASLHFIDMKHHALKNRLSELFAKTATKGHLTEEMYYKFLAPSILAEHDKAMIADVDVIYLNDVSQNFLEFDISANFYVASHTASCPRGSWIERWFHSAYAGKFCEEDIKKLIVNGGYNIFNLRLMRESGCESRLIEYATNNCDRLVQPDQDTMTMVFYPKIKPLPSNSVVFPYLYGLYLSEDDYGKDLTYSATEVKFMLNNPIQLHYVTVPKPWQSRGVLKADVWFEYLAKTPFADDVRV